MVGSVASLRSHWLSLVIRFLPSLVSFGGYPLTLLPQSACVRDFLLRTPLSNSLAFSVVSSSTTCLSFIILFFSTFYSLVTPASAPRLLFLCDSIGSTLDLKNYAQSFDFPFFLRSLLIPSRYVCTNRSILSRN